MRFLDNLEAFLLFVAYLAAGLALLGVFVRLYLWVTPYDDMKEIHAGQIAPAIALAGAMLGFTFPLLVASYLQSSLGSYVVWSAIACGVQLGVFTLLHRLMPPMIETNNAAGALCFAMAAVCAGLINAASFIP
jgi:putative membrane protein